MKYEPKRLRRLEQVWINRRQPTYFITICTANRTRNVLATHSVHRRLRDFLHASASHHDWWAGRYVLMPDHLHLLAASGLSAVTLGSWIKALKGYVASREFKWQPGFFDHVLRSGESQSEKWEYIRSNPVRAGLVSDADDWPFAGEIDWTQGDSNTVVNPSPRQETRPTSATELLHYHAAAGPGVRSDQLATEAPLEIRIEGRSVAVVMRTPGHDRELAAGFCLSENLIRAPADIFDITQCGSSAADEIVNVTVRDPTAFDPARLTRNVFSSSSCGVCSKATIEAVRQSFPAIKSNATIRADTLLTLPQRLREKQETFAQTGGLHACAIFDLEGHVKILREDVGRHNALDKLIGRALLDSQLPLARCVLFLSGRVSFEMMQKALAAGIPIVGAISAPTSLAVEFARESNQTLVGFVRGETMNIYAGDQRIAVGRVS